ncbi:MAG: hypothetical protein IPN59_15825 [Holophaga sp.]|nr:hypothetical protein [Holophaga sp.]
MNRIKWMFGVVVVVAFAILAVGCTSTTADNAPKFSATGEHPAGWLQSHWADYSKNPGQCSTCHGSTTNPAQAGGISKVSCFTCHADGPGHPAGWADPAQHGRLGAMAAPGEKSGFAYCAKCHGATYKDGLTSTTCLACHTKAPHPDKPWETTNPMNPIHSAVHQGNAPECYKCHKDGQNSTRKPYVAAPLGTAPGCFNNTLCHDYGQSAPGSKL